MNVRPIHILFVSRCNMARSILAQACLDSLGKGRFRGFSCGAPEYLGARPDPLALAVLAKAGIPSHSLVCTGWDKIIRNAGPRMDWVINLATEVELQLPRWPGQPEMALWSYPDLHFESSAPEIVLANMVKTLYSLHRRLELVVNLPFATADKHYLRSDIRDIGYSA